MHDDPRTPLRSFPGPRTGDDSYTEADGDAEYAGSGPAAEVAALGQSIIIRLLSAGLDTNYALALAGDGAAASRLQHAIGELDDAVRELRLMVLAAGAAAGSPPGTPLERDA